ncbi:MAG: WYL domain-containing protein, partial [Caldilineae bacterium]
RRHLAGQLERQSIVAAHPFPLVHDVIQVLFFLHQQPKPKLQYGRWLARSHLVQLNRRLMQPAPTPIPSHKRSERLCFLFFLARAAGLIHETGLSAYAWTWLAEPPAQQLVLLWRAWLEAPAGLREAYDQPGAYLPAPWPHLFVQHLAELPTPFSPAQLADRMLAAAPAFQGFFLAYMNNLSELEALLDVMLAGPLHQLGVVAPWTQDETDQEAGQGNASPAAPWYGMTPAGRWLLQPTLSPPPPGLEEWPAEASVGWEPAEGTGWLLALPVMTRPEALLPLAPFVEHLSLDASGPTPVHRLRLDPHRVAQAASQGHALAPLLQALQRLGVALTAEDLTALAAWHEEGRQLVFSLLPVLQARNPSALQAVLDNPQASAVLGEVLNPTLAIVAAPWREALDRLARAGVHVATPFPEPGQRAEEEPAPAEAASGPVERPKDAHVGLDPGALWLMGQVYARLAHHMPLPPPPFAELAALYGSLPPAEQAGLAAQLQQIEADLADLLDGFVFTPPPQPTEPDRWLPMIRQAVDGGDLLEMDYFVAGRNLLTHRVVQPHFLEEREGRFYMRAYCHSAGRVLRFRLDRIQALGPRVDG